MTIHHSLSSFFPWDLPVVEISPEWVTSPEQGKSSSRFATFSLWTGMFRDGISSTTPQLTEGIMVDLWRDFWIRETGTGQQVAQIHDRYMMMMTSLTKFYIHGSVHCESNLITVQQDATYSVYYISVGSSTCFGCWHPTSGAGTAVITASGIDQLQWVKYVAVNTNI